MLGVSCITNSIGYKYHVLEGWTHPVDKTLECHNQCISLLIFSVIPQVEKLQGLALQGMRLFLESCRDSGLNDLLWEITVKKIEIILLACLSIRFTCRVQVPKYLYQNECARYFWATKFFKIWGTPLLLVRASSYARGTKTWNVSNRPKTKHSFTRVSFNWDVEPYSKWYIVLLVLALLQVLVA
jgi:hypothetical protein